MRNNYIITDCRRMDVSEDAELAVQVLSLHLDVVLKPFRTQSHFEQPSSVNFAIPFHACNVKVFD